MKLVKKPSLRMCLSAMLILASAVSGFAQMDLMPMVFRDLPPEFEQGIPSEMSWQEFQQLNRNVDFFTVGMSMIVPGFASFDVGADELGWTIAGGRTVGYAMMATGVIRQWRNFRYIWENLDLPQDEWDELRNNAFLFGAGAFVNLVGWGADVLSAYYISRDQKNYVIYKYGLQTEMDLSGQDAPLAYARRLSEQDDIRVSRDLIATLGTYLRRTPFVDGAAEADWLLAGAYIDLNQPEAAIRHLLRLTYLFPESGFASGAGIVATQLTHQYPTQWRSDMDFLLDQAGRAAGDRRDALADSDYEARYLRYLRNLSVIETPALAREILQDTRRFIELFPLSRHLPEVLALSATLFDTAQMTDSAALARLALVRAYPDSEPARSAAAATLDWLRADDQDAQAEDLESRYGL